MVSQKDFRPADPAIPTILFLGDSITHGGDYVTDVECGLLSRGLHCHFLDLGLSSESGTDLTEEENAGHLLKHGFGKPFLSERLERVLGAARADVVFACYGMNDGSSLPRGPAGVGRYGAAMAHLRERAFHHGAKEVVLCTPPVRDPRGEAQAAEHHGALVDFTKWLLSQKSLGWAVVDIHTPMLAVLSALRQKDPGFAFASDGVHPGREGHFLMAREILGQHFGVDLVGLSSIEGAFNQGGARIRELVDERRRLLFSAWMTKLGHTRPGTPGGPGAEPGPTLEVAQDRAREIEQEILKFLGGSPAAMPFDIKTLRR